MKYTLDFMAGPAVVSGTAKEAIRASVRLPTTSFPMRAGAAKREPLAALRLTTGVFRRQLQEREGKSDPWVLLSGPPYANGPLHAGHLLNIALKDVLNRTHLLRGKYVTYRPGWDCHGLPIELKARGEGDSVAQVREKARIVAQSAVEQQAADCQRWGVLADWGTLGGGDGEMRRYLTMDASYEANELRVLAKMVSEGLISRQLRPVHWSCKAQSALAEAELEYREDHESVSLYVGFEVAGSEGLGARFGSLQAIAWTTTPWTLPGNVALAVHPDLEYVVARFGSVVDEGLVAADRVEAVGRALGLEEEEKVEVLWRGMGTSLEGLEFRHPFLNRTSVVVTASHVDAGSGTGVVHTAPGHGPEDFAALQQSGREFATLSPVDETGRLTEEAGEELCGRNVLEWETQMKVVEVLGPRALKWNKLRHRYPYDWRFKSPVIFRATPQWFVDLSILRDRAAAALNEVDLVPAASRHRLESMLETRSQWCISRQRPWGVPIPALYFSDGRVLLHEQSWLALVADEVEKHGSNVWWERSGQEWFQLWQKKCGGSEEYLGREDDEIVRGDDTLDVWFDSGVAWATEESGRADVVLEGSDQHRGWFQSLLLTSVASGHERAPYSRVITHGFVMDGDGKKMSKSLGNVVAPSDVIDGRKGGKGWKTPFGADVIRVWAASTDFTRDVSLGEEAVQKASEKLRRFRNTARFFLGSLSDWQPQQGPLLSSVSWTPPDELAEAWMRQSPDSLWEDASPVDRFALWRLKELAKDVDDALVLDVAPARAMSSLQHFLSTDASAIVVDVAKDRLYCDPEDAPRRRTTQAVLWELLRGTTLAIAPVAPFTAEDVYQHSSFFLTRSEAARDALASPVFDTSTIFDTMWSGLFPSQWDDASTKTLWTALLDVRSITNRALEAARAIDSSATDQGARIELHVPESSDLALSLRQVQDWRPRSPSSSASSETVAASEFPQDELAELLRVSHVAVLSKDRETIWGDVGEFLEREARGEAATTTDTDAEGWIVCSGGTVTTDNGPEPLLVRAKPSHGAKCARCWKVCPSVAAPQPEDAGGAAGVGVCARCAALLAQREIIDGQRLDWDSIRQAFFQQRS